MFAEKCQRKSTCPWRLFTTKREGHEGHLSEFLKHAKACVFFQSSKCVCFSSCISTQHVIRVSSAFLASKATVLLWQKFAPILIASYLLKVHVESFQQKDSIDKTWFLIIIFYCTETENRKKIKYTYFSKNSLNFKKTSTESDQHWTAVQKSHTPPFSKIPTLSRNPNLPTFHRSFGKTKKLNNSCNQFLYHFYSQSILVLEKCLQEWWNANLI